MNKTLLALSVSALALAGIAQASPELSIGAGVYNFDGDRNVDNDVVGKIGLGFDIPDSPFGVEGSYFSSSAETPANQSFDLDGFQLDGIYNLSRMGQWSPYLAAGVGELSTDTASSQDSDRFLNFGGGTRYSLSDALDLRADLRAIRTDETDQNDLMATLSLVFGLGAAPAMVKAEMDSDGDGVLDGADFCPSTPAGAGVDGSGCALDEDADGVADYQDDCLGTGPGLKVDASGCPVMQSEVVSFNLDVEFETDSARIRSGFTADIESLADFMDTYPNTEVMLGGHTDSVGSDAYNLNLSQTRADAVKRALIVRGVQADRITAQGFGEARPISDNQTAEGREQNRRVVASVTAVKNAEMMK